MPDLAPLDNCYGPSFFEVPFLRERGGEEKREEDNISVGPRGATEQRACGHSRGPTSASMLHASPRVRPLKGRSQQPATHTHTTTGA